MKQLGRIFLFFCLTFSTNRAFAKENKRQTKIESEDIETIRSEHGVVKYKMYAKKLFRDDVGDIKLERIEITFYDQDAQGQQIVVATLRAHQAVVKNNSYYAFTGDVEVKGYKNNIQANTEAFFWDQDNKKLYTDKFVRIQKGKKGDEVLTCQGMIANQDFTVYELIQPEGFFKASSLKTNLPKSEKKNVTVV